MILFEINFSMQNVSFENLDLVFNRRYLAWSLLYLVYKSFSHLSGEIEISLLLIMN